MLLGFMKISECLRRILICSQALKAHLSQPEVDRSGDPFTGVFLKAIPAALINAPGLLQVLLNIITVEIHVPDFVQGDQLSLSVDSRYRDYGTIKTEKTVGKACFILWPLSRFGSPVTALAEGGAGE